MTEQDIRQRISEKRLQSVRAAMGEKALDAFVVFTRPNAWYLSQFECTSSALIITDAAALLLTDFRYAEAAHRKLPSCWEPVIVHGGTLASAVGAHLSRVSARTVGFEGQAPYDIYAQLAESLGEGTHLIESGNLLRELRSVKDPHEIELIARAQELNETVLRNALEEIRLRDQDLSELDVQRLIRHQMLEREVEEAFPTIVAANENSALPHAVPEGRSVGTADVLLVDMGVRLEHYCSDMTRTILRKGAHLEQTQLQAKLREIFDVVQEAQQAALESVKSGIEARTVDAAARTVISKAGYGDFFGHGLGHGVGIEIHEAPTLNPHSTDVLRPGMVITIEPGIYLPGIGGVRIEDLVVVTESGYRNLTAFSKEPYLLDVGA